MKRNLINLLFSIAYLLAQRTVADNYSTDAIMSVHKDEGTFNVDVRVSRLSQQDGKPVEQLIASPRIESAPGVPASVYVGLRPTDTNYANEDNVTVDVSWPFPNEMGTAFCGVIIRHGKMIVSQSRLQLNVEGPGRAPLVLSAQQVSPASVRVVDEKSGNCVLLEFAGKTKEEVKRLAVANYGNRVQVRDWQGRLTEGGASFGTYHEIGMCLQCKTADEAKRVAGILRGGDAK